MKHFLRKSHSILDEKVKGNFSNTCHPFQMGFRKQYKAIKSVLITYSLKMNGLYSMIKYQGKDVYLDTTYCSHEPQTGT